MQRGKHIYLALLLVIVTESLQAQLPDYHLQLFDYTVGIQPGTITSVAKDQRGCLWILYRRQIQRFDGKRIETFRPDDLVDNLMCDSRGRIWASTPNKAFLFSESNGRFEQIAFANRPKTLQTGPIFETSDHRIRLVGNLGIFEFDSSKRNFIEVLREMPIPRNFSSRTFGAIGNSLFLRHGGELYRYNTVTRKVDSLPDHNVNKIFMINEDSMLVSSWKNDSYWFNFKDGTIRLAQPLLNKDETHSLSFNVRSVAQIDHNRFFIAAMEGIFEYNNLTQEYRRLQFFHNGIKILSNDYASYIYLDKERYAWMATMDGIVRFPVAHQSIGLIRLQQLDPALPASINNVRKITEDDKGNLWMATGYGFACWKKNKTDWEFFLPKLGATDQLAHPSVRGLVYDGKYLIVGPTDLGIWLFDPQTKKYKRPDYMTPATKRSIENDFVNNIITLKNGNHFVVARDAVYLLHGKDYRLEKLDSLSAIRESFYFAGQRKDGLIWMSTGKGLHCLDSNLKTQHTIALPFDDKFITCAFILPDDRLLFACTSGLFIVEMDQQGQSKLLKLTNLFDKISLQSISADNKGIIWASSEMGIYRFDPVNARLNLFDYADNVQGYGFNGNGCFRGKDGILYFGGVNGINYLQPETFTLPDEKLDVYIRQAKIGTKDSMHYIFNEAVDVDYNQRSIEVEFASAYFNNQAKVRYRYQLVGLDDEWKDLADNNLVRFTSLPPGSYTLKLQASINRVNWVPAKQDFSFNIHAPLWMTWWFLSLVGVLFALAIAWLMRSRNRKIAEKHEELETEQAINYFASSIYETNSVKAILWDVVKNCIGRLHFEDCVIYLLDEEKASLVQQAAHGLKSPSAYEISNPLEIPVGQGITGSVALSGKAEIVPDTSRDSRYIVDVEKRNSEIAVPIVANGKVLGVIDCEHSRKGFFTQKHLSILTTIASLCANKIVKAKAEAEKARTEAILMDTQQKMADVEMQALRAQMNPHFIFNCLNSINRYIVKSDQATASLYLTRFAKLIRLILDNSNSKTVTLTNELDALRLYIEMESIRFEKKFSYKISVDPGVQADSIYVPPLIIQPYVENAIWHGLLHKETAGELFIHIRKKNPSLLECVIEDNGVGREKAKELRSKSASTKKSLGMKLTEDRLALLNKQAQFDSSVEVEDMRTDSGEARGTRVIVKIPIDGEND